MSIGQSKKLESVMAKTRKAAERNRGGPTDKATQATSSPPEASSSGPNVEVWTDLEWEPALHALQGWAKDDKYTGKPDPKPLAKLLRSGKPVPGPVAVLLGVWLDPPWGKKGPRLTASIPKRYSGYADLQTLKAMIGAQQEILEAVKRHSKLDAAIKEVGQRINRSRSWLMRAWKLDLEKNILMMSKYNPQPISSPREPGRS